MAYEVRDYEHLHLGGVLVKDNKDASILLQELVCLTDMLDGFTTSMRLKVVRHLFLGKKTGWDNPTACPDSELMAELMAALADQDWVSAANYAMFLWNRGMME